MDDIEIRILNGLEVPINATSWNRQIPYQAENIIAEKVLPKYGFKNIIQTSGNLVNGNNFPFFDILAEKDGKKCGIVVSTASFVPIRRKKGLKLLLNFFDMRCFYVLVRPNLKQYIMEELIDIPSSFALTRKRLKNLQQIELNT